MMLAIVSIRWQLCNQMSVHKPLCSDNAVTVRMLIVSAPISTKSPRVLAMWARAFTTALEPLVQAARVETDLQANESTELVTCKRQTLYIRITSSCLQAT